MQYLPLLNVGFEKVYGSVMQIDGLELTDRRIERPAPDGGEEIAALAEMICALTCDLPDASIAGVALAASLPLEGKGIENALKNGCAAGKFAPDFRVAIIDAASAFALGAARGQDGSRVLCLRLDESVDSAYLVDGRVSEGGRISDVPFLNGVVGDYLSQKGLSSVARRIVGQELCAGELLSRAQSGDSAAIRAFKAFGLVAMEALMPTIRALSPNALVLGGSVGRAHDYFAQPLNSMLGALGARLRHCPDEQAAIFVGLFKEFVRA